MKRKGTCPDCGHVVEFIDYRSPFDLTDTQMAILRDAVGTVSDTREATKVEGVTIIPVSLRPPRDGWTDKEIHIEISPPKGTKVLAGYGGAARRSQPWGNILISWIFSGFNPDRLRSKEFDIGWFATDDLCCPFDFGLFSEEKPLHIAFRCTESGRHAPIEMVIFGQEMDDEAVKHYEKMIEATTASSLAP